MKRFLISGLLGWMLYPQIGWATDLFYTNNGTITFPPQIDAVNVINNGTFDFTFNSTVQPFETLNTRNFTNNKTMIGAVGFQFDNAPSTGPRKMAANFHNRLAGRVTALDIFSALIQSNGVPLSTSLIEPSYLRVSATNIINEGVLTAGSGGILRLVGTNVDVTRSGLQINPIPARGSVNGFSTNYYSPDVAMYDWYWGQTNQNTDSSSIIQNGGGTIVSPSSEVQYSASGGIPLQYRRPRSPARVTLQISPSFGGFYTNTAATTNLMVTNMTGSVSMTNLALTNVVQAVFVQLPSTGDVDGDVKFAASTNPDNPFRTVTVRITSISTNVVTVSPDAASIYLVDTLASETNRSFYTNFISLYDARPQNYRFERGRRGGGPPNEYARGSDGNADFSTDLLYKPDFASARVTNEYAAYSAFVDNIASRPPNIPSGTATNLPGRIEVLAENLDMTRARFRADGLLDIRVRNLVSSSNTVVDCENLNYILGATNGNLKIQNLANESVDRFLGYDYVWSGVWTNTQNQIIENYAPDPADTNVPPTTFLPANITNVVEVRLYAMIFDASDMLTKVPVFVNALATHSTNVVLNDNMTVVQSLFIDGTSFTLNGGITLSNTFFVDTRGNVVVIALDNWIGTNAPNLKYFTNNGTLNIPSEGHFGDDLATPYSVFVNKGTLTAFGQTIKGEYCEIGGANFASAGISLLARSGKVEGGSLTAGGDVQLFAGDFKFNRGTIQAGSRLDLTVTNALFDAGGGSGNSFSCSDGFRLLRKPQSGDLLGTAIETVAPDFAEVDHVWAGEDRGPTPAGFLNNTALGTLLLTPGDFEAQYPPLFFFAGLNGGNALYVDLLDLSNLADFQNEMQINPDLVIYFAAAKLSFTPPLDNGAEQLPEEYLDGQFDGHLRWVSAFAGPKSSVDVIINGQTAKRNRALRNSKIIDSDNDGIANFYDANPFDPALVVTGAMVPTNPTPAKAFLISWTATSNTVYRVEYSSSMSLVNWQLLLRFTNNVPTNRTVSVWDTNVSAGSNPRFYRVGHGP